MPKGINKEMKIMSLWKARKAWIFAIIMGLGMLAPMAPTASQARVALPQADQGVFRHFAERILSGIGSAKFSDIPAIGGYGMPRVAVLPFSNDETDVPPSVASELNSRLLAELTRQGSRLYRFVSRDALKSIIKEIDTIGELDPGNDGRVQDLLRNARVDILIVGRLRTDGTGFVLSYEAVSVEDGTLFAATGPRRISGPVAYTLAPATYMSARDAMRQVAWRFARSLGDGANLSIATIGRAPDGTATEKGDYLTELLADSLRYRLHRPGRRAARVRIEKPRSDQWYRRPNERPNHTRIKGRYWDLGHSLEVRLVLHRPTGTPIAWRQRISTTGLPGSAPYKAPPKMADRRPAPVVSAPVVSAPAPGPEPRPRANVRSAQRLLTDLGYYRGPVDGVMRARTRAALRAFQRDEGVTPHGRLTRDVMRRLRQSQRLAKIAL